MDHTSPEDYDDAGASDVDSGGEDIDLKQESSPTSATNPSRYVDGKKTTSAKAAAHLKRRRVTRACDECRRKKIKCDGKQPCTHCTVYSYECTYDQPSNRRRNPAPQYVENLEHRVHRAETLLHILIPNLDLSDPGIDAAVAQGWIPGAPGKGQPVRTQEQAAQKQPEQTQTIIAEPKSDKLESMVRAVAQIDMDESGNWDYHGHSSGLSFIRRMREQLGDLMGPDTTSTPFIKSRPMSAVLDSPKSAIDSPQTGEMSPTSTDLPPKQAAREICRCAIEDAAALLRAVHGPTFWAHFDHLYSVTPEHYSNEDQKFLPLFHSAMALGHLFIRDEQRDVTDKGYENAIQQGFVHFKLARSLMDIADCRDMMGLQAIIMMILFLQSSAKLSQCYAYVGIALRSALRMGLHRNYKGHFDPLELETRKRVFWVVRKLDIYVGAMLGLPQTLSEEDIDQEFPVEVDDEYVTRDGILPMNLPEGQVSLLTAFNRHTRLVQLLSKIVRCIYPIKVQDKELGSADQSYSVPFSVIREIESDLEQWKNDLPAILSPCPAPARYTRVQHLLRLSYAHIQTMLYRPFLHYVARSDNVDQRAYACGASYVGVSRNIIHIATQMKQTGLLNGAFWFIMYTSFFAILSLVYFAAENPDNHTTQEIMRDAIEGKEVLASLANRSMAADRCTATLDVIFQRLPDWMRNGQQNPIATKKRSHNSQHSTPRKQNSMASSKSHPDVSSVSQAKPAPSLQRRSVTLPQASVPSVPLSATQETWPRSAASSLGPQTPTSAELAGNYMNYNALNLNGGLGNQGLNPYSMPTSSYASNSAITDLSTMIFPAHDEPFGYPHQPLTTFENNQQYIKSDPYSEEPQSFNTLGSQRNMVPQHTGQADDNIEAQFFALPPYLGQQQFSTLRSNDLGAVAAALVGTPPAGQIPNGWPGRQVVMPPHTAGDASNINVQDIFGGVEWNAVLMNGFQPQ